MAPLITVVITAYNRAALLPRALHSLGSQTFRDWEAVVVDDGSADATSCVAVQYMSDDERVRLVWQPNQGLVGARNAGIAAARTRWVTFLDSDDEYAPEHLRIRMERCRNHPDIELLHGGLMVVGGADSVPDKFDPSKSIALADCYVGGTFVFLKSVWERLGGFRLPNYGDDHDFMTRALAAGVHVESETAKTYIYHRDTPDGLCNLMASNPSGTAKS